MALSFDGSNDVVTHGDIAACDNVGVLSGCLWIKVKTGRANNDFFIGKGSSKWLLSLSGDVADRVQFRDDIVSGRSYTASSVTQDVWEWWAFVWDGSQTGNDNKIRIWKNGVQETLTHAASWTGSTLGDGGAAVVSVGGASPAFTPCEIAHVKLWAAALSAAEIVQEMYSYRPQRTANLILWAPYDDGTNARDYSGQGNHGTVTEAVQIAGPPIGYGAPSTYALKVG